MELNLKIASGDDTIANINENINNAVRRLRVVQITEGQVQRSKGDCSAQTAHVELKYAPVFGSFHY